jgi:hypothetical protein
MLPRALIATLRNARSVVTPLRWRLTATTVAYERTYERTKHFPTARVAPTRPDMYLTTTE